MKLLSVQPEDIFGQPVDLFIAACGYEARAPQLAKRYHDCCSKKVAYAFSSRKTLHWEENRTIFKELGFGVFELEKSRDGLLFKLIVSEVETLLIGKQRIRIVFDYSCVTRSWLAVFLRAALRFAPDKIDVYFVYSIAEYEDPPKGAFFNEAVEPIPGFWSLSEQGRPVALVLGLGYEPSRALGAREMLDPAITVLFFTDPVDDPRFSEALQSSNEILLNQTPERNRMGYAIRSIGYLDRIVGDVCEGYSENYSVVIVPLGPKPFCLAALVVSRRLKGVEVWRVSGGGSEEAIDRKGTGEFVAARLHRCTSDFG